MCIVLVTTSHPDYALVVINNRDEFIVRPTSRPHWWTPSSSSSSSSGKEENDTKQQNEDPARSQILSSRDLARPERGTWLGVTRTGRFACLTNYREQDSHDAAHPVHGLRSRGAIVSAWLAAPPEERTPDFVGRILSGGGVKGVGGFSLLCGQLRPSKREGVQQQSRDDDRGDIQPLAIISNRSEHPETVPWIAAARGETHGLSNAAFDSSAPPWPKVQRGRELLEAAISRAASENQSEDDLVSSLFSVLDTDTLPRQPEDTPFEDYIPLLKHSIFVPPLGGEEQRREMDAFGEAARARAVVSEGNPSDRHHSRTPPAVTAETTPVPVVPAKPDEQITGFMTGLYGTQRQTVILFGWDGSVRYTERALWDEYGQPIERGAGDMTFRFHVDGWEQEEVGQKQTEKANGHC